MADPETKKKIERYRHLHLLRERPVSGIGLAVLLLLVAAGLYVLRKLLRELRQDREKRE